MDKALFDDLLQSLTEAKTMVRRKKRPSGAVLPPEADVKSVRERTGLSQTEFARLMRVSTRTLQNWEQRRRQPTGPAAALLAMVATAPDVVLRTLHS
jgi:putative transcriptional regulator